MPRAYGITNAAPYASAPAVGLAGDTYWNTAQKTLYVSDGTAWNAVSGATGAAGGDLSGSFPNPTVVKASGGFSFTPPDGTVTASGILMTSGYVQGGANTTAGVLVFNSSTLAAVPGRNYRLTAFGNLGGIAASTLISHSVYLGASLAINQYSAPVPGGWLLAVLIRILSASNAQAVARLTYSSGLGNNPGKPVASDYLVHSSGLNPGSSLYVQLFLSFSTANAANIIDCWQATLEAF